MGCRCGFHPAWSGTLKSASLKASACILKGWALLPSPSSEWRAICQCLRQHIVAGFPCPGALPWSTGAHIRSYTTRQSFGNCAGHCPSHEKLRIDNWNTAQTLRWRPRTSSLKQLAKPWTPKWSHIACCCPPLSSCAESSASSLSTHAADTSITLKV